jgi:dipeptidyl aminopeptidase/acylaminoacyl peptidase
LAITGDAKRRPLLAREFNEDRPALSPDGRWLAYESDESGRYEIYVRPFPNIQQSKQQVSEGGGQEPRWSPDGGTLYFLGPKSVMATQIRTDPAFSLQPPHPVLDRAKYSFQGAARQYDVAPGGQRLLLAKAAAPGARPRIVVVTNWLEELKRLVPAN